MSLLPRRMFVVAIDFESNQSKRLAGEAVEATLRLAEGVRRTVSPEAHHLSQER